MSRTLVTVKSLLKQVRDAGVVQIVNDALITPAAAEWLATNHLQVRRSERAAQANDTAPRVHLIGDVANAKCRALLPMLDRSIGPVEFHPCQGRREGLLAALRETCAALAECDRRRGVVLVRDGALVSAVANKHPAVRAAIVARPGQLAMLIRDLAINLLIVEHDNVSLQQTRALIEAFVAGRASLDPAIAAALTGSSATKSSECRCQHEDR